MGDAAEDKSQKTEKPTPKHKREAQKEGRVARSAEIGSWFSLGVVVLALPFLGKHAVSEVSGFMSLATDAMPANDPAQSVSLLSRGLWTVVEAVGPIVLAAAARGRPGRLRPGGSALRSGRARVQVEQGLARRPGSKRIFSARGAWEITKMALRLVILIGIGYGVDRHLIQSLLGPGTLPIAVDDLHGRGRPAGSRPRHRGCRLGAGDRRLRLPAPPVQRLHEDDQGAGPPGDARDRRQPRDPPGAAAPAQAPVPDADPRRRRPGGRRRGEPDPLLRRPALTTRRRDRAPRVVTKGDDDDALAIRERGPRTGRARRREPTRGACRSSRPARSATRCPRYLYQVVARLLAFLYRLTPAQRALVDIHKMAA